MAGRLEGRAAIVTGASKGIGRGIARVLAREGARVVITGRDREAGRAAEQALGSGVRFVPGDVSRADQVRATVAAAVEHLGGVDVLCANAGIYPEARLEEMTEAQWDEMLDVNAKGSFLVVQACLPQLRASAHGRVVLVSSITGPLTGIPGNAHYGASKAAQLGFMRSAALELARFGVTVNAVLPGNIVTEGLEALDPGHVQAMRGMIPLGRVGAPEDIGHAVLYLASDEAAYVTGQTLVVDGGQTLPEYADRLT